MDDPLTRDAWRGVYRELIARNGLASADAYIYVQVTRGAEFGRNHAPLPDVPRTVFAFASPWPHGTRRAAFENGMPAVTADDTRWARCDIKSVSLLANVLLRQLACDENATETILLRDGQLTDASASSVHVVIDGELRTPPNSWKLLPGTTRGVDRRGRGESRREMALGAGFRGGAARRRRRSCWAPRRAKSSPSPRSTANRWAAANPGPSGASFTTPFNSTNGKSRGRRGEGHLRRRARSC